MDITAVAAFVVVALIIVGIVAVARSVIRRDRDLHDAPDLRRVGASTDADDPHQATLSAGGRHAWMRMGGGSPL